MRVILHPDLPDVLAKVDLVTSSDTALYVTDFKTSRSRWTPEKATESGDQLVMYASATAGMAQHMKSAGETGVCEATKRQDALGADPTGPRRYQPHCGNEHIRGSKPGRPSSPATFNPNPGPMTCSGCPFKSRCPVFGGR